MGEPKMDDNPNPNPNASFTKRAKRAIKMKNPIEVPNSVGDSSRNLFEGKEGFFAKNSKQVAESSKQPIYKRHSNHQSYQSQGLRRISILEWEEADGNSEWLDLGCFYDDELSQSTSSTYSPKTSQKNPSIASKSNRRMSTESTGSRRFLVHVDYDEIPINLDHSNTKQQQQRNNNNNISEWRSSMSKSFLISFQHDDDDEDLNTDGNKTDGCRNTSVRPLFSMNLAPPVGDVSRCDRRRSITVEEVVVDVDL